MIKKILKNTAKKIEKDFQDKLYSLLEKDAEASFLDLGCYDGTLSISIANKIGTNKVFGVEINSELAKKSKENGIVVKSSDLNHKIDFGDNSMDIVFSNQVIEHLYDIDRFVFEIYRVLKPGGYAIIGTVNIASWHNIACLIVGWQPFDYVNIIKKRWRIGNRFKLHQSDNKYGTNVHVKPFTISALKEIFTIYNFEVEEVVASGYYPLIHPLYKIFQSLDSKHSAFIGLKIRKK